MPLQVEVPSQLVSACGCDGVSGMVRMRTEEMTTTEADQLMRAREEDVSRQPAHAFRLKLFQPSLASCSTPSRQWHSKSKSFFKKGS